MKASKRIGPGVSPAEGTYFWRSPTEALVVRASGMPGVFQLSTLDATAGREQPLTPLNQRLRGRLRGARVRIASPTHPEGEIRYLPPSVNLSPDGAWLLWYGGLHWTALSLEGPELLQWRQPSPLQNPAVWLRDGRHWAELEADAREGRDFLRRALVHDLQNPLEDRTIETPALEAGAVVGFTPEGRLLIRHAAPVTPTEEALFTEVDLSSEAGILRPYRVGLPRAGEVVETELSPDGNRLAWVLAERKEGRAEHALWISRANGDAMTLVGTFPAPPASAAGPPDPVTGETFLVRWLPGENALSFVASAVLYRLSLAEQPGSNDGP